MSQRHNLSIGETGTGESRRYKQCFVKLSKIFNDVQTEDYGGKGRRSEEAKLKLLDAAAKIFHESGLRIFCDTIMRMMLIPFKTKEAGKGYMTKLIMFFFDLISDPRWSTGEEAEDDNGNDHNVTLNTTTSTMTDDGTDTLPVRILKLCEKYHSENRAIVRLRLMQTVEKILSDAIRAEDLKRNVQIKMIRMLGMRRKDKNEQVRVVALKILCRFYKPGLPFQVPIEDELLHHMSYDPDPTVRLTIVSNIPINENILEVVLERTGDPSDKVRAAALYRAAKDIRVDNLTQQLRESILKANAAEDSPKIVQKALNAVLQHWLEFFENQPTEFLRMLDVRRRPKLCRSALDNLYSESQQSAFEKLHKCVLNERNYPEESLCNETTYLWHYLYDRFHNDEYAMNKLRVSVKEMIEYIDEFMEIVNDEGDLPPHELASRSWMLGDLLQILCFLPLEEGERQDILNFLPALFSKKRLIDVRISQLGVKLISICSDIKEENQVIDLVNGIINSDRVSTRESIRRQTLSAPATPMRGDALQQQHGQIVHRFKRLEKEQSEAAKADNMDRAEELQIELNELQQQINDIKASMRSQETSFNVSKNESMAEDEEEPWPYSDKTMLISIAIVKEMIEYVDRISDFSATFNTMYASPALSKSRDPSVRALALQFMTVVAMEDERECSKATAYCLTALLRDTLPVKISALKCLFDLVLKYSFVKLGGAPEVQNVILGLNLETLGDIPRVSIENGDIASTFKTFLLSYIRREETALVKVSVAGVLKLLLKRELNFSRIVTTFLINWAIPSHETRLRFKDVGIMIPVYATIGEEEATEVSKCLLQCIKKTYVKIHSRAMGDTTAPHPDLNQIISLIVGATHPQKLAGFQRPYIGHQTIALEALKQLQDTDLISGEKLQYAQLLKILDLGGCSHETIRQMIDTANEVAETGKKVSNILAGFISHLQSTLGDENAGGGNGEPMEVDGPGAFDSDED